MNKNTTVESGSLSSANSRNGAVDVLKTFAILSVLVLHSSTDAYYTTMGSFDWYSALFWGVLSRAGVPIFLMVSGALTLDPAWNAPLKKLWTRNIPRLAAAMLFWAFSYRMYHLLGSRAPLTFPAILEEVKHTLLLHHEFHLYYLHIILLAYALLPMTRLITAHGDRRTLRYLLCVWFVLGIFLPTFQDVWPFTLLYGIPIQYPLQMAYSSIGYTLLGWYLARYARSSRAWAITGLIGLCMVYGGTVIPSLRAGELVLGALEGDSPGVMVFAMGICGMAFSALRERAVPRWCTRISRASFCIYLVHVFFLYILKGMGLTPTAGLSILFIPLLAAATLACSLAVWCICSRIPVVRSWLI